jgi:hypothetical protein
MNQTILKPPSLRWQQTRRAFGWLSVAALLFTWAALVIDREEWALYSIFGAVVLGLVSRSRPGLLAAGASGLTFITVLALEWNGRQGFARTPAEARIRGLPADATNIVYWFSGAFGPNAYYEFDTTEQNYRAWVARQKLPMEAIRETHDQRLIRFRPGVPPEHTSISHALASDWTDDVSPDCGAHLYFDLDAHRAYFWFHSR